MSANPNIAALLYLVAGSLFILALKGLSSPASSRAGNRNGMIGMTIAVLTTLWISGVSDLVTWALVMGGLGIGGLIGAVMAKKIAMTDMPQLVAAFHSLVGMAAVLTAGAALYSPETFGIGVPGAIHAQSLIEMSLGVAIGAITFSGSVIAFAKLNGNMSGAPILLPARHLLNLLIFVTIFGLIGWFTLDQAYWMFWAITILSFVFGITLIIPIGGADMPVVISLLNSFTGMAAAFGGFLYGNQVMLTGGILVGSAGTILTVLMCNAMNRSLLNVIIGSFGGGGASGKSASGEQTVREISLTDTAILCAYASKVTIVPGYGLAVAQAQHICHELEKKLEEKGVDVSYAIHPVAGRMPGHMNVLLAEADVPYPKLIEMEEANPGMSNTDVVIVVGANDVVNPAAENDPSSPIYGMPVLKVWDAKSTIVLKRSMRAGYAGIENELFFLPKTKMLFGDAKDTLQKLVGELKDL